jgi:hypothetical protein
MSDLVASPALCDLVLAQPEAALGDYELSDRERRRIVGTVGQPGMRLNCTLYRINRITPLYTLLKMTCELLGDDLMPQVEAFWAESKTELQFSSEIELFAVHLRRALDAGELSDPYLAEVLDFELAMSALQFAPRRRVLAGVREPGPGEPVRAHPLMRAVGFRHDPYAVLEPLAEDRRPPAGLEEGDFHLLLDGREKRLSFQPLDPAYARALRDVGNGEPVDLDASEVARLVEAGALVAA